MMKIIEVLRKTNKEFHLNLDEFQIELLATRVYQEVIMNKKEHEQNKILRFPK